MTSFFSDGVPADLPIELATGLYRITQEALRNVAKHAGRAHVKLSLVGTEECCTLRWQILERGSSGGTYPGLGLVSMKERARLIGATANRTFGATSGNTSRSQSTFPRDASAKEAGADSSVRRCASTRVRVRPRPDRLAASFLCGLLKQNPTPGHRPRRGKRASSCQWLARP